MPWIVSQRLWLSQIEAPMTELPRIVLPHEVEVQAVAAERVLLAQVAELGVADRAGRAAVIHRVPADARRIGRFDDDVAAQVGDLAAEFALAEVLVGQRLVERDRAGCTCPSIAVIVRSSVRPSVS